MSDSLRDRLIRALVRTVTDPFVRHKTREELADDALSVLTEGVEVIEPHREGCEGELWAHWSGHTVGCKNGDPECMFEARVPGALLVELVEAKGES